MHPSRACSSHTVNFPPGAPPPRTSSSNSLLCLPLSPLPQDIRADLKLAKQGPRSPYYREYVLPDGVSNFRGYVRVRLRNQNLHASVAFFFFLHGVNG